MLRRLSCSLQFTNPSFGQLLCPSPSFIHSLLSHSISPCSQIFLNSCFIVFKRHISKPAHQHLKCSLGYIPIFRCCFISAGFSPPAANISCARRLAIACVPVLYWHIATLMQACHIKPLHCAPITACRLFYCAPQSLALAGRIRSFVPHSLLQPLPARSNTAASFYSKSVSR